MKILSSFLLATALLFSACGTAPNSKEKTAVLKINLGAEPQTLDPGKARDLSDLTMTRMIFDGLTRVNKEEKAELAIAEKVSISDDLKTYTFTLRKAEWNNGDPVTAEDFAYAWKRVLNPKFPADNANQLYVIKNAKKAKEGKVSLDEIGVRVIDSKTLQVELENATPYFLELTAFPAFFPINHLVDQKNPHWAENAQTYVSNGPFSLKSWKHNDQIEVQKNPKYWDASAVKIGSIQMPMINKEETELMMYEKKDLDWAGSPLSTLTVDALKSIRKSGALQTKPALGTYFMRANVERFPFNNVKLRKAFAMAINRQAIVDHVTQGNQIPATGLTPISMGLQKSPYFNDGAVQEAKELFNQALQEGGLTMDNFPEVTLTYASNERNHLIAQAVQQQWFEAFGIRVQLHGVEKKVYYDRISKQDYQLASGSWIADFNDPVNFLEVFKYKTASTNNTNWHNPEYVRLLDVSSQTKDQKERSDVLAQSEKILMDEMPLIPIFHYTLLYVKNDKIRGEVLSSMGTLDFKWAEINADKR